MDGGPDGGGVNAIILDPTPMAQSAIAMAVGPNNRVGISYFRDLPPDAGFVNACDGGSQIAYQLRYAEWQAGATPTTAVVQTVENQEGSSIAFQQNGQPAVAYLGGGSDGSCFWTQSDTAISYRQSNGTWGEQIAVRMSDEAVCSTPGNPNPVSDNGQPDPVSDSGFVVGLFPALTIFGPTAYLAYRDVHYGQAPVGDYDGSDLEVASGGPTSWSHVPVQCGGNDKLAYGGHLQMVLGPQNQPALVSDQIFGTSDGKGINVLFHRRNPDGTWTGKVQVITTTPITNTQWGASLAYDSTLGYVVAVVERGNNTLYFTSSLNGTTWTFPDQVFQNGTGGWYPSVAVDPSTHEPHIAFYICSNQAGVNEGSCPPSQNRLVVYVRNAGSGIWNGTVIDPTGGIGPKLAFLSNGKRVIAYRDAGNGALKLYVDP